MQKKIPTFDSTAASQHQDDGMDMMMGRGGVGMHGGGGGWGSRQGGFQGGAPIPGYGGGIPRGPPQPPRGPPPGGMGGGEYNGGDGSAAISLTGALSSDPIGR